MIEFNFAQVDSKRELEIDEEQMYWIGNVDKREIGISGSQTRPGGRPAVSFHDPQLPLMSRAMAKSSLEYLVAMPQGSAYLCTGSALQLLLPRRGRSSDLSFSLTFFTGIADLVVRKRGAGLL